MVGSKERWKFDSFVLILEDLYAISKRNSQTVFS